MNEFKKLIREVPDFPKPGILFYDITTLLNDKSGLRRVIDAMTDKAKAHRPDVILGIEARGFIFAPAIAYNLGVRFVPVRKPKKLPAATEKISYALEYGTDTLEIHSDAVRAGDRVSIVDDLLATGGSSLAAIRLVEKLGATVSGVAFVIELDFLKGRDLLNGYDVSALIHYDS